MERVDTVILGGGIAGLALAEQLAKKGQHVTLLEKYPTWGGRIVTFRSEATATVPALQYEIGAGRIHKDHTRVAALVKRFGLTRYPIGTASTFHGDPNPFSNQIHAISAVLDTLDAKAKATHTIQELLPKELHPMLEQFPYRAEVDLVRADLGIESFKPSGPMGATGTDFYGLKEGLDAITNGLAAAAAAVGADLRAHHHVDDAKRRSDGLLEITGSHGKKEEAKPFHLVAKRLVIATCRCSLSDFSVLKGAPLLKQLSTSPLIRIYAVYPKNPSTKKVWFDGMEKVITEGRLRHVIPIRADLGLIMISYTDGKDCLYWRERDGKALQNAIQAEARTEFPDKEIPEPVFLKKHDWTMGCTYWTPGDYDVEAALKAAHHPSENVFVVGESVSREQAWIEGALESVERLLEIPAFKKA